MEAFVREILPGALRVKGIPFGYGHGWFHVDGVNDKVETRVLEAAAMNRRLSSPKAGDEIAEKLIAALEHAIRVPFSLSLNGFAATGVGGHEHHEHRSVAGGKRYRFQSEAGTSLKDCLLKAGILEGAECGGRGICGKCAEGAFRNAGSGLRGDESFLMTRGTARFLPAKA